MTSPFLWRQEPSQILAAMQPSVKARATPGVGGKKRPIEQLTREGDLVRTFVSIAEAARSSGVADANIVRAATGIRATAGGFRWRYPTITEQVLAPRFGGAYSKAVPA